MKSPKYLVLPIVCVVAILCGCGKRKPSEETKPVAEKIDDAAAVAISNRLAAIEASGQPVTPEGLNKLYPQPGAGDNAAELYQQAFKALVVEDVKSPAFFAQNQKVVPLLLQAASRSACRYPLDFNEGASLKLPHLSKIKTCASLLEAQITNQMARGQTADACKAFVATMSLARSLENEPIIISRLVVISSVKFGLDGLEQALCRKPFNEQQYLEIQAALKTVENSGSFQKAMLGEQCSAIRHFSASAEEWKTALFTGTTNSQKAAEDLRQVESYLKSPAYSKDFMFALDYVSNLVAISMMSCPQCLDAQPPKVDEAVKNGYRLSAMLLPALGNVFVRGAESTARTRIAETVVAVERYRLKHSGSLPASLSELVPSFLEAVPADPMDGQPLRYRKLSGKGYVVYSVGKDRKDDDGVSKSADGKTQLDIPMTITR